jgi:BASS family bile acid:Na+ symporter
VDAFAMMLEIVKIVLVPVGAALLHDYLKFASAVARRAIYATAAIGVAYLAWLAFTPANGHSTAFVIFGFGFAAVIAAVVYHHLAARLPWLDGMMPAVSMFGIVTVIAVTTAAGRNNLLAVGGMLFVAAAMHNGIGYMLGYGLARACGLGKADARTIAIEVGLHNGGMAAGIATAMGKLGTVGLASAIFSPWMNVSGSILANYWRRRPVHAGAVEAVEQLQSTPVAPAA